MSIDKEADHLEVSARRIPHTAIQWAGSGWKLGLAVRPYQCRPLVGVDSGRD